MKIVAIKTFILLILLFTFSYAQDDKIKIGELNDCPPLYTRFPNRYTNIEIVKVGVVDSNKYSALPNFFLDNDSLAKLIYYPEIAKRASVEGDVVIMVNIDANGIVIKTSVVKAIGAGCDEAALDILSKTRYYPATIIDDKVPSEILVYVNFSLTDIIDKPDTLIDEIIYEDNDLYNYKKLTLDKLGNVNYFEIDKWEEPDSENKIEKKGKINIELYTRLSDFIISQCFLDFKNYYYNTYTSHRRYEIITVKIDPNEKRVSSNGQGDPVGLWAILNLIKYFEDQIEWEEVE